MTLRPKCANIHGEITRFMQINHGVVSCDALTENIASGLNEIQAVSKFVLRRYMMVANDFFTQQQRHFHNTTMNGHDVGNCAGPLHSIYF